MANKHKTGEAVYQKIAAAVAEKIAEGKYDEGSVIFGRSSLAAQYNVSPETVRRAAVLLQEWGVTESAAGSGIKILSREKALTVTERLKKVNELADIKNNILRLVAEQKKTQEELQRQIDFLLDYIEKHRLASPVLPYEIKITGECKFLGKKISEINFWQQTGVTVVAISRNGKMAVSPGPNAVFAAGDSFVFVGPEGSYAQVHAYLYNL